MPIPDQIPVRIDFLNYFSRQTLQFAKVKEELKIGYFVYQSSFHLQLKLKAKLSVDLNINVILRENKNIEIASFLTNYKNLTLLFFHLSLDKHKLKGKIYQVTKLLSADCAVQ